MKHYHKYISLLTLALGLSFSGCQKAEELIFDEQPEMRTLALVKACNSTLLKSQYGWQMDYKTGSEFTFRFQMQFQSDGYVKMYSDFDDAVSSTFTYNLNRGAVLSFDSYGLLHKLADPTYISPISKGQRGTGYLGDFEFIIDRVSADSIFMRGFKHNEEVVLIRLSQAPNVRYDSSLVTTLKTRLTQGAGEHKTIDKAGVPIARLAIKEAKKRSIYSCIFDQFTITVIQRGEGDEVLKSTHTTKNTIDGIDLMPAIEIGELSLVSFKWDDQKSRFVSVEHPDITLNINSPTAYE